MTKYQELVENAEKTTKLLNNLKLMISVDFVLKLCQALDCETDNIEVEFGRPKYLDRNKMLNWDFTLVINVLSGEKKLRFPLDLSLSFIKDTEDTSSLSITYYSDKMSNPPKGLIWSFGKPIDDLADLVFTEIKKKIDRCLF